MHGVPSAIGTSTSERQPRATEPVMFEEALQHRDQQFKTWLLMPDAGILLLTLY